MTGAILRMSKAEIAKFAFVPLCKQSGIMTPVPEFRFDPRRRWRFDFCWPEAKLALEVDGGVWTQGRHTRGAGWNKDSEKLNAAASMGWRMLRVTPSQLCTAETIGMIQRAMEPRG